MSVADLCPGAQSLSDDVTRRKLSVTLEDCKNLDGLCLDPIDDPVVPLDDLANAGPGKLRNRASHLRELHQPVTALNDAMDELFRSGRVGPSNEILDLDEAHERLFRPNDLQG